MAELNPEYIEKRGDVLAAYKKCEECVRIREKPVLALLGTLLWPLQTQQGSEAI